MALEEHFVFPAIREANARSEWATRTRDLGDRGLRLGTGVLLQLEDVGESRLAEMDAAGIDLQVLSHTQPGVEDLPAADATALARAANDYLADAVATRPERFSGLALLPTGAPEAAAAELQRAVVQLRLKGAIVNGRTDGAFLDAPRFTPILEAAAQLKVPIYLHPAVPPRAVRDACYSGISPAVDHWLSVGAWGWHVDTGLHALRLVAAGVFDRFPQLQVILGHMGEALPYMLDRTNATLSQRVTGLQREVKDYFLQNFYFTTSGFFSQAPLSCLLASIGIDRLMFAVDYPYSSNLEGRKFLDAAPLDAEDRAKIAHSNAERLLGL